MLAGAVILHSYSHQGDPAAMPYFVATWLPINTEPSILGTSAASPQGALRKLADQLDKREEQ